MGKHEYDAIVVGSGVSGSYAVKELTERGLDVCLLEAGPNLTLKDFKDINPEASFSLKVWPRVKAFIKGQHRQARYAGFSDAFKRFYVNDRENPYTFPKDKYYLWIRGRQLGGRLHTYGRISFRMSDYDFKAGSHDGKGDDWPISYGDLKPYYDRTERFFGIIGTEEKIANLPDGIYEQTPKYTDLEKEYKIRVESKWKERKVIPLRFMKPNLKRIPKGILAAQETGRLTLKCDAVVKKITVDARDGRATGIQFINRVTKKEEEISANVIVLCASAIETIRIMFNSGCSKYPNGLGNSSGMLGRYYLEQCPALAAGVIPYSKGFHIDSTIEKDPLMMAHGVYVPRFTNLGEKNDLDFYRGYGIQMTIGGIPVADYENSMFGMLAFGESLPDFNNRITVNPRKKDAWGIPVAHIDFQYGESDRILMTHALNFLKETIQMSGFEILLAGNANGLDITSGFAKKMDPLSRYIFKRIPGSRGKVIALGGIPYDTI